MLKNRSYVSATAPVANDFDRLKKLLSEHFKLSKSMQHYKVSPKKMECIFKDSTVESEAKFVMQQMEQLYLVHVEYMFRLKHKSSEKEHLETVLIDWKDDPTGERPFPNNRGKHTRRCKHTQMETDTEAEANTHTDANTHRCKYTQR